MVKALQMGNRYITVSDSELDELLRGEQQTQLLHKDPPALDSLRAGEIGVLVELGETPTQPLRPLALVCHDEDVRRLCGRYAHVRTNFSPLTAWCHLLSPAFYKNIEGVIKQPRIGNTASAWSGLVIAETLLISGKPLKGVRISACLASATYAVARTLALWDSLSLESIVEKFDSANILCRGTGAASKNQARLSNVRSAFLPLWKCLDALNTSPTGTGGEEISPLVVALNALQDERMCSDPNEAKKFVSPLLDAVPEAQDMCRLTEITPESRLSLFDELVSIFEKIDRTEFVRRNALGLVIGYLATVAAGGAASLALVESRSKEFPELTGWAYLVGGIGQGATWTSGFDGLGRLVARELLRPLRLDESPTCDFAFDEAGVLADKELKEPLVHLRIKQAKVLSVSLYPGVNIAIPIVDDPVSEGTYRDTRKARHVTPSQASTSRVENPVEMLAQALWPYLKPLVIDETTQRFSAKRRSRKSSQQSRQKGKSEEAPRLPFEDGNR